MIAVITGFEPFNGASTNASWEAVKDLPGQIGPQLSIHTALLPVTYEGAAHMVRQLIRECSPSVLVHVGLSAKANAIMVETTARNVQSGDLPDNAGIVRRGTLIDPVGPGELYSTWNAQYLATTLAAEGFPVQISDDAGRYVCNTTLYTALQCAPAGCITGFIHVPPQEVIASSTVTATIARLLALL